MEEIFRYMWFTGAMGVKVLPLGTVGALFQARRYVGHVEVQAPELPKGR